MLQILHFKLRSTWAAFLAQKWNLQSTMRVLKSIPNQPAVGKHCDAIILSSSDIQDLDQGFKNIAHVNPSEPYDPIVTSLEDSHGDSRLTRDEEVPATVVNKWSIMSSC